MNPVSLQGCREKIADNQGALMNADGKFFSEVEQRFDGLKSKSAHAADFRRLSADLRGWVARHTAKDNWNTAKDQPAYDGATAWIGVVDKEVENRVIASASGLGIGSTPSSGWVDAQSGEPIRIYSPDQKIAEDQPRASSVSVGDLVAGMLLGPKREDVRATLQEGTGSAGGYSVPTIVLPQFIDRLRAKTQFINAGAKTMMLQGGTTKMVRTETDPVAGWRAESAAIAQSEPSFSQLVFQPKSLAVLVKASREVMADSVNIAEALQAAIIGALSLELDRACFFGAGTANEPLGLANTSGISTVSLGANGGTPSWDSLIDMLYALESANSDDPTAVIWNPRTAQTFRKLKDSQGRYLEAPDPIAGMPKLATNSVPITQTVGTSTGVCSTVLMGDFSDAILGMREFLHINVLHEKYADTGELAFVAHLRADVGFEHAQEFCALTGVKP